MRKVFAFVASIVVIVGFVNPVGAMSRYDPTDDYCKRGTFDAHGFTVVCEDDYLCDVVIAKTFTGECWWRYAG